MDPGALLTQSVDLYDVQIRDVHVQNDSFGFI
jgi:hypothetical protein